MKRHLIKVLFLFFLATGLTPAEAVPLGTRFTYQGRLDEGGTPVNGLYDFNFRLYDQEVNGTLIGPALGVTTNLVAVTNGVFSVSLDFGAVFEGSARWLDISVNTNAARPLAALTPRQPLHATPYALHALKAGMADMASAVSPGAVTQAALAANAVTSLAITDGTIRPADLSLPLLNETFWNLLGNLGTDPSANFLGTRDAVALTIRVNDKPALRVLPDTVIRTEAGSAPVEPIPASPNIVGGFYGNTIHPDNKGATIAGGGSLYDHSFHSSVEFSGVNKIDRQSDYSFLGSGSGNYLKGPHNAVLGGHYNRINDANYSLIGAGGENLISVRVDSGAIVAGNNNVLAGSTNVNVPIADAAFIGAGHDNLATNQAVFIGAGGFNLASGAYSTITGGKNNQAMGLETAIGGGRQNFVAGVNGTIAGGVGNSNTANYASIGGGFANRAAGQDAAVAGGSGNAATAGQSTIGGGIGNRAEGSQSTVSGGALNKALGVNSTVGGGQANTNEAFSATIGGGQINLVTLRVTGSGEFLETNTAINATIGGGTANQAFGAQSVIGGGANNRAERHAATVTGGEGNTASGGWSTVAGGKNNSAAGQGSLAAGTGAIALHNGSFAWSDGQAGTFSTDQPNQFAVRAQSGVMVNGKSTLLDLRGDGGIRVANAGVNTIGPIFTHRATAGNVSGAQTTLDHPHCNNRPNAILLVTYNFNPAGLPGTRNDKPTGIYYTGTRWAIYNLDGTSMPVGTAYNVLVVNP